MSDSISPDTAWSTSNERREESYNIGLCTPQTCLWLRTSQKRTLLANLYVIQRQPSIIQCQAQAV